MSSAPSPSMMMSSVSVPIRIDAAALPAAVMVIPFVVSVEEAALKSMSLATVKTASPTAAALSISPAAVDG